MFRDLNDDKTYQGSSHSSSRMRPGIPDINLISVRAWGKQIHGSLVPNDAACSLTDRLADLQVYVEKIPEILPPIRK